MKIQIDVKVLVGWIIFLSIYAVVWDSNISHMMRISAPLASMASKDTPFPRSSIFLLGAYTVCRVTLLLSLILLLTFCIMSCVQCILPFMQHITWLYVALTWIYSEGVLFSAVTPKLLPFHAAVFVSCLAISTMYAVVYPCSADLVRPERCMSIIVRDVLCMSGVGLCAYAGLALFLIQITPP